MNLKSDINYNSILNTIIPKRIYPFAILMRLDRPIGTWLLLIPCWLGLTLASGCLNFMLLKMYTLFGIGAIVMRGAGCVFNDIVDCKIDIKVARTANRPVASGEISIKSAWIFLIILMFLGFLILVTLNHLSILLGIFSLALIFTYPFMKRITYWPQAFLGLTFNWGALLGYAAIKDNLDLPAFLLYVGGFFWTLGYDTIYAHQDKEDDLKVGIKSSALALGNKTKPFLCAVYTLSLILVLFSLLLTNQINSAIWLIPSFIHFIWQIKNLDLDNPLSCLYMFKKNRDFGLLVLLAFIASIA